jgi:hypothetical protein
MESVFAAASFGLLTAAVVTYVLIVRDVMPHLAPEQRYALRQHFYNSSSRELRAGDKAIGTAWQLHTTKFPNSRKRKAFSGLLIAAALSVFGYPLWLYFR